MFMNERTFLDLPLENGQKFFFKKDYLNELSDEISAFLADSDSMKNIDFAKKVLFSHELQSNNQVEGYHDDVEIIDSIIKRKIRDIKDVEKQKRILNLYRGYKFILKYKQVNPKSLRKLYDVLSNGLLIPYDLKYMGELYREDVVYILSDVISHDELDQGVDYHNIEKLMESYFAFYNEKIDSDIVMNYVRSQILHFYFVYIHPYFDVNGRTSRTMSMWYLIKNEAYPFIIFNRGIPLHCGNYYSEIKRSKISHDLTGFLLYMLMEVKIELEKEYVVQSVDASTNYHLTSEDFQTILYFLSINGNRTALDFGTIYNHFIDKRKIKEIYEKMIVPLIDKDILKVTKYCKKAMYGDVSNIELELNKQNIDLNPQKIKRIKV